MVLRNFVTTFRGQTRRIEPWWTLIGAPVIQESIFRFVPYRFVFPYFDQFWLVGIASSVLFAAIHWYFGKWLVLYSFAWGLILWWLLDAYGFVAVVIIHASVNFVHLRLGVIKIEKV